MEPNTLHLRRKRAERLERWAETAMHQLMRADVDSSDTPVGQRRIAVSAWSMALAMEDERTRIVAAIRDLAEDEP